VIFEVEVISVRDKLKCERCLRHVEGVGKHDYWPTYTLCPRCVEVLLEIKWPPYILRPGTEDDYYLCQDEAEWFKIKLELMKIPKEAA
jgi:hypothetical protein